MRPIVAIVLPSLLACTDAWATQNDVTVYRCTDARGQVELRDTPCAANQRQQTTQMLRPKDAPPTVAPPATAVPPPRENVREVHYILRQPRPLYECTAPDGSRYLSGSSEGNARWQQGWIVAPAWGVRPPIVPLGGATQVRYQDRHASVRIGGHYGGIGVHPGIAYAGGAWVRDSCALMPQERMCATLVRQRDDIRRRNVLRQPSEQARLDAEESTINTRLRDECGG